MKVRYTLRMEKEVTGYDGTRIYKGISPTIRSSRSGM